MFKIYKGNIMLDSRNLGLRGECPIRKSTDENQQYALGAVLNFRGRVFEFYFLGFQWFPYDEMAYQLVSVSSASPAVMHRDCC